MDFFRIFTCLKDKKTLRIFILSTVIITFLYFSFSILLALWSKGFPKGNFIEIIMFGAVVAFSSFKTIDWIILALFPLAGGLLFGNCSFWKCKTKKSTNTGLAIGFLAAICPACLLPIFGATFLVTFLTRISIYIKIVGLMLIVTGTYYVANTSCACQIKK